MAEDPGPLKRQLELLLSAHGYNLYNDANRARADDLLVRERASALLGQAATRLKVIAADYSHRFIPASTRDQPFPPADRMAVMSEFTRLQSEMGVLSSRIRGLSVPPHDKTWAPIRKEERVLHQLLNFDYSLIRAAEEVAQYIEPLDAGDWTDALATGLRSLLRAVEQTARERDQFLFGTR
ncbi:MAG: hypothetical protein LC772_12640 [Chloroflexi bacterium]|nr:hypothetical protein [Chloroflexota bacterium]